MLEEKDINIKKLNEGLFRLSRYEEADVLRYKLEKMRIGRLNQIVCMNEESNMFELKGYTKAIDAVLKLLDENEIRKDLIN